MLFDVKRDTRLYILIWIHMINLRLYSVVVITPDFDCGHCSLKAKSSGDPSSNLGMTYLPSDFYFYFLLLIWQSRYE